MWEANSTVLPFFDDVRSTRELYTRDVLDWEKRDYQWALAKRRFGNPNRNIEWWGKRSQTLWNDWEGDPFNMFVDGTVESVIAKKDKILLPGIGPKIASLIAIFFEGIGLRAIPDAFPVDVHVQRFCLAQNIIRPKHRLGPVLNETLEQKLRHAIADMCRQENWSRSTLSHAIWFQGNGWCTNCWQQRHIDRFCPVFASCLGAYESRHYFKMGLWLLHEPRLRRGNDIVLVPFDKRPLFAGTGD
jgi:hypothetical protein